MPEAAPVTKIVSIARTLAWIVHPRSRRSGVLIDARIAQESRGRIDGTCRAPLRAMRTHFITLVLFALAGCGGADDGADPEESTSSAQTASSETITGRVWVTGATPDAKGGLRVECNAQRILGLTLGSGKWDASHKKMS